MNNQGSWRDAYQQTLRGFRPPTGVTMQSWVVFVDSVITGLMYIDPDTASYAMKDIPFEYIEPEEFGYQGVIEGLKLLTTNAVEDAGLDEIRTSFAESSSKTAVDLWAHLLWILDLYAWDHEISRMWQQEGLLSEIAPTEAVQHVKWLSGAWEFDDNDED